MLFGPHKVPPNSALGWEGKIGVGVSLSPQFQDMTGLNSKETEEPIFLQLNHIWKHFQSPGNTLSQQNKMRAADDKMSLVLTLFRFISEPPLPFMFRCHRSFFKTKISRFLATGRIAGWGRVNEMDWISCLIFFRPQVWLRWRWRSSSRWHRPWGPAPSGTWLWVDQRCR